MNAAKKTGKIAARIQALGDKNLAELILALKFSTNLEQSMLATALAERRRRVRKAKAAATP